MQKRKQTTMGNTPRRPQTLVLVPLPGGPPPISDRNSQGFGHDAILGAPLCLPDCFGVPVAGVRVGLGGGGGVRGWWFALWFAINAVAINIETVCSCTSTLFRVARTFEALLHDVRACDSLTASIRQMHEHASHCFAVHKHAAHCLKWERCAMHEHATVHARSAARNDARVLLGWTFGLPSCQ